MMRPDKSYTDEEAHLLDMMLMVHAEHGGGNNSTFVCRAMSSSGTDTYSAIAGAVGSLKGPLHGGANAKVMEMFRYVKENVDPHDDGSIRDYLNKLLDKQAGDRSGKIYGLGHAVYTMSDPRAVLLKKYAQRMAELKGYADDFALLQKVEEIGIPLVMERKGSDTPMCANVDMYSGLVYTMLGIPEEVFTPLFASARIAGWCANRIEEKDQIGKRYRRMDAIGCPYCVTVDQQTLEDNTVTLRDRDTMEQRRVAISDLRSIIEDKVSITSLLKNLI